MQSSPLLKELIESKNRFIWISWLGFLLSSVLYIIVAYLGTYSALQRPSQLTDTILYGCVGIAIVAGVCSLIISRVICSETKLRKKFQEIPKIERLAKSRGGKVDHGLLDKLDSLTLDEQRIYSIFSGYTGWYVVIEAVVDLIAVIGLVPAILGRDFQLYFYFGIPAIVLKVLHYPKGNAFLELIELIAQKGAVS